MLGEETLKTVRVMFTTELDIKYVGSTMMAFSFACRDDDLK